MPYPESSFVRNDSEWSEALVKDDRLYLRHIIDAIEDIDKYTATVRTSFPVPATA